MNSEDPQFKSNHNHETIQIIQHSIWHEITKQQSNMRQNQSTTFDQKSLNQKFEINRWCKKWHQPTNQSYDSLHGK